MKNNNNKKDGHILTVTLWPTVSVGTVLRGVGRLVALHGDRPCWIHAYFESMQRGSQFSILQGGYFHPLLGFF